jgi:TolA-binding protein
MNLNLTANKGARPQERFASPLAISGLIGAGILLLMMLYPEKSLLALLSAPEVTTPAQQRYLEILVKVRSGDADLKFSLVRSYLAASLPEKARTILEQIQGELSPQQVKTAETLMHEVRRLQGNVQVKREQPGGRSPADAKESLSSPAPIKSAAATVVPNTTATTAGGAIARGDYRRAAALLFQEMSTAPENKKRTLYLAAVRTLQSGNLLNEALTAAESHLGTLENDREVLIYLTRLALAANRPERAQYYIHRALDITNSRKGGA